MEHGVQNQVARSFNTTIRFALWSMGFKTRWLVPSIPPYSLHYGARGSKPGGSILQYHHTICIMEHGVQNQVARSFNTTIRFALLSMGFKTRWLVPSIPPNGFHYRARGSKPGGSFLQYRHTVFIMEHGVQNQVARSFNTTERFALWSTGFKTRWLVPSIPPYGFHYGARGSKPGGSFLQYHHTVFIMEHGVQNQVARSFNTTIRFALWSTGFKTRSSHRHPITNLLIDLHSLKIVYTLFYFNLFCQNCSLIRAIDLRENGHGFNSLSDKTYKWCFVD